MSPGPCPQEADESQTACGYPSIVFRRAFTACDEALENSQWPVATWHFYSKRVVLPSVGRHLQKHRDVFRPWW